jgi:glycosyltransferase involved in cell wall biosynthesis
MTPWKGQHYLLEAFAQLADDFPHSYLLLVGGALFDGDNYEQQLHQRSRALGLENRVIFTGYRTDLPQTLAAMDIFAYPSTEKDTSPLALLSAMAVGLPIVAFDIAGIREVIGESEAGLLVPVKQVEIFAQWLAYLLTHTEDRQQMAWAARSQAEERFSLQSYVSQMEDVLHTVCKNGAF